MSHIYLEKDSNDLVSHCRCETAYITFPPQLDCPWCGCGWLFTCLECRRAFTFARAVEVRPSWRDLAIRDMTKRWKEPPDDEDVDQWVEAMMEMHSGVVPGQQYVYIDGRFVPSRAREVAFEGWYASHDLRYIPQVVALSNTAILDETLGSVDYWRSNALAD